MSTFLIIDDDSGIVSVMKRMLELTLADSFIVTATDGEQGVACAFDLQPDLIVSDINLPGMRGQEVCRILKTDTRTARIPMILITGDRTSDVSRMAGIEMGADSYLYKPFAVDEFIAQVRVLLRMKSAEDHLISQKELLQKAFYEQTLELQRSKDALESKVNELETLLQNQTKELIRADRLASVGVLAAGIAHEVNNPNTFISSNLLTFKMFWQKIEDAFGRQGVLAPDEERQLQFIREEMPGLVKGMEEGTRRIAGIVTGMKSYASGSSEQNRIVDLADTVNDALQLVQNQVKHDIEIRTQFAPDLPKVFGSDQLLCQVFVNLFLNAAHAMQEHRGEGCLTITGYADRAGFVVVEIRDDGPGIQPEAMRHLFDPFFTTRREQGGTGLGLFVSHGIIKGHGGQIEVETDVGKGTTFLIKIPAIKKEQAVPVEVESDVPTEGQT